MRAKCLILLLMPLLAFSDIQDIPNGVSLTPIELSLVQLSPQALAIITANPTVFTPSVLQLIASNPTVFTPSVLQLIASNPTVFTPSVLQLIASNPSTFTISVLQIISANSSVFTPSVLHLIASNPTVFTPSVLQFISSNPTLFTSDILATIHIEDIELTLISDGSKWGYDFSQMVIFYHAIQNVPSQSWFGFKYRAIIAEYKVTGATPELMKKINDLNAMLNKVRGR